MELEKNENRYVLDESRVMISQVADEGVLYDLANNEYKTLNETMYKIVLGLQQGHTINEVVASLVQEYRITPQECLEKVSKTIELLTAKSYLICIN